MRCLHLLPQVLPPPSPLRYHPPTPYQYDTGISTGEQHAQTPMTPNIIKPSTNSATPHSGEPCHQTRSTTSHFISQHDVHPNTTPAVYRKHSSPRVSPSGGAIPIHLESTHAKIQLWRKFDWGGEFRHSEGFPLTAGPGIG